MDYVSYFRFLEVVSQIIHDVELDFKTAGFSGDKFESEYKSFMNRLIGYCQKYKSTTFRESSSAFISTYINDISTTMSYPHKHRFERLSDITKDYIKRAV